MAGKYDIAVDFYSQAISADETNSIYYSNRANAYLELKVFDKCIIDCKKALEINPQMVKAFYRMAKAHFNIDEA